MLTRHYLLSNAQSLATGVHSSKCKVHGDVGGGEVAVFLGYRDPPLLYREKVAAQEGPSTASRLATTFRMNSHTVAGPRYSLYSCARGSGQQRGPNAVGKGATST